MRKITIVSFASLMFLLMSSVVAYYLRYAAWADAWKYLLVGVGILLASSIIAVFAKENTVINLVCFFMSSVALGFCIRSWYVFRGFDNSLAVMALVSLAAVAYLCFFALLSRIPFIAKYINLCVWIYIILSTIGYIIIIFTTKTTFVSTFGYYMIVESAFILAMCKSTDGFSGMVRALALSTYSIFAAAAIIALFMLAGDGADCDCGDCGDCCDCSGSGDGKSSKRKKNNV
jgi:hypothetical protein